MPELFAGGSAERIRRSKGQAFFELIRVIREFGDRKPKIIVLENSPFLRYGDGGAWFLQVNTAPDRKPKNLTDYVDFDADVPDDYYLLDEKRYADMIRRHIDDCRSIYQLRKYFVRAKMPGVCPTLTANMGLGGHNVPIVVGRKGLRKLTEHECLI
jgi:DNA (cytosine-5)-methyltransferase 1